MTSPHAFTREEWERHSSGAALTRAVAAGRVTRMLTGVYAPTEHASSWSVRVSAALLWAGPGAAVAGTSALWAWGLIADAPSLIALTVRPDLRLHAPPWLRLHRFHLVRPVTMVDDFPAVDATEAVVRGFAVVAPTTRSELVYRAVRDGLTTPEELALTLKALPRLPRRNELRRVVGAAVAGAESFLEERALATVFQSSDFAALIPQHTIAGPGWRYRLDLYDHATRTCFELDGARYHANPAAHARDAERDARLASIGIQTVRFTYEAVVNRPEWCRSIAREVLAARSGAATLARAQ